MPFPQLKKLGRARRSLDTVILDTAVAVFTARLKVVVEDAHFTVLALAIQRFIGAHVTTEFYIHPIEYPLGSLPSTFRELFEPGLRSARSLHPRL